MATFFYESFWNAIGVVVLLIILNKIKIRGITTASYFVYYGIGRSIIEGMRTDSLMFLGLRVSQWLSIALIILGVVMIVLIYLKYKKDPKSVMTVLPVTGVKEDSESLDEKSSDEKFEEEKTKTETDNADTKETAEKKAEEKAKPKSTTKGKNKEKSPIDKSTSEDN